MLVKSFKSIDTYNIYNLNLLKAICSIKIDRDIDIPQLSNCTSGKVNIDIIVKICNVNLSHITQGNCDSDFNTIYNTLGLFDIFIDNSYIDFDIKSHSAFTKYIACINSVLLVFMGHINYLERMLIKNGTSNIAPFRRTRFNVLKAIGKWIHAFQSELITNDGNHVIAYSKLDTIKQCSIAMTIGLKQIKELSKVHNSYRLLINMSDISSSHKSILINMSYMNQVYLTHAIAKNFYNAQFTLMPYRRFHNLTLSANPIGALAIHAIRTVSSRQAVFNVFFRNNISIGAELLSINAIQMVIGIIMGINILLLSAAYLICAYKHGNRILNSAYNILKGAKTILNVMPAIHKILLNFKYAITEITNDLNYAILNMEFTEKTIKNLYSNNKSTISLRLYNIRKLGIKNKKQRNNNYKLPTASRQ